MFQTTNPNTIWTPTVNPSLDLLGVSPAVTLQILSKGGHARSGDVWSLKVLVQEHVFEVVLQVF